MHHAGGTICEIHAQDPCSHRDQLPHHGLAEIPRTAEDPDVVPVELKCCGWIHWGNKRRMNPPASLDRWNLLKTSGRLFSHFFLGHFEGAGRSGKLLHAVSAAECDEPLRSLHAVDRASGFLVHRAFIIDRPSDKDPVLMPVPVIGNCGHLTIKTYDWSHLM